MSDLQFKLAVQRVTRGKIEVGLADVMIDLANAALTVTAPEVARQLRILGFRRDGDLPNGTASTPRCVWG